MITDPAKWPSLKKTPRQLEEDRTAIKLLVGFGLLCLSAVFWLALL